MRAKLLPIGTGVILITPSARPELLLAVEDLLRRKLRTDCCFDQSGEHLEGKGKASESLRAANDETFRFVLSDTVKIYRSNWLSR